ncbi:MAG TPA: MFS transporter [Chloroflexota bacterium]|jgi:MFS family permease|nr:MFS transporter [Chloroflexota bacterium]
MRRPPELRLHLAVVLLNAGDGIAGTLAPLYFDQRGYPVELIGVLVALYAVAGLLSRLPSGIVYRPRRAARLMYAALALQVVATALYPVPADAWLLGVVRAVHGFAVGMATTVNMATFMDSLAADGNRHRHLAGYASALAVGYTIGGLAGGLLGYWLDYAGAFVCAAGFPLLAALCVTTPPPRATATERPAGPASLATRLARLGAAVAHPQVALVSLASFVLAVLHAFGQTFVPLYAANVGLNLAEIGLLRAAHSATNALARPFCGELTGRFGYQRVTVVGMAVLAAVLALTPWQTGLLGLTALFVGVGLCRAAVLVANTVSVADVEEGAASRGVTVAVYNAARDLGVIVGPVIGGFLAGALGLRAFFWVGPPLVLALYGLLLWGLARGPRGLPTALPGEGPAPGRSRS